MSDPYSTGAAKGGVAASAAEALAAAPGVTLVQKSQWAEVFASAVGIDYEAANKYKVGLLPPGVKVRRQTCEGRWVA